MARRRATRKYETLFEFVNDYNKTLINNAINLPAGSFRGELANQIKLDLSIPEIGRVGPIQAQVVFRDPSGDVALRLPEVPKELPEAFAKAKAQCESLVKPYVDAGLVVSKEKYDQEIADLKSELEAQRIALEKKLADEIARLERESEEKLRALAEELEAQRKAAPEVTTERGIPIVDFSEMKPASEGKIEDFSEFLMTAAQKEWTGLLYIESASQRRFAYLDQGGIVAWRSDPMIEKEVLGVLLYNFKQITKEQLEESLRLMEEKGIRQGEAFMEMGIMNFPQMVTVLSKQVEYIFQQVRKLKMGTFYFYECDLPEKFYGNPIRFINIRLKELRTRVKRLSTQAVFRNFTDNLTKLVYLNNDTLKSMRKASLSGAERKSIAFLQTKPQLLRDILKLLPLPKADVNSFVWILKEIGLLSFERPSAVQKSKPAQKKVDPTKRIHQKIMEIERGTFFDVLELHWICVSQEIEKSYQALHAQFKSFGSRPEVPLILSGLKEAYEELKDTDVRREYRAKLFHQQILLQAATELASHAEGAIQKKDKTLACLCYSKALELCPAEQGFRDGLKRAALS